MKNTYPLFYEALEQASSVVFFGGAGVSTESGIPDFRSKDGLYNMKYDYPPETMLSYTFYRQHTAEFYRFYKDKILVSAKPNATHYALAKLEKEGKLSAVITQNIDGLHQDAGSKTVYELHGSVLRNYCTKCHAFYDKNFIINSDTIPLCTKCQGLIKPDVVLYEEALDDSIVQKAIKAIEKADMLIVGGTSLVVYPAAGLINYFKKNNLFLINKSTTSYDSEARLVINESLGAVFGEVL